MNILIGDISSYKAIVIAKYIHKKYPEIKIFSFDSRGFTKNICTKYVYQNFVIQDDIMVSCIDLIKKNHIDFFIPVINSDLKLIWQNKDKFYKTLSYLGNFDTYNLLNDKSQLHDLAVKLQIKVPKKYEKINDSEVPFVIKPTNLSSSQGVNYIFERSDIPEDYNFDETIIQQYIKGTGVGYSFYCKDGEILDGYGHRRLAEFPVSGGSSTYRAQFEDERMIQVSRKIVQHLNYTGFAMFEFLLTRQNELYLLEVNPRIWGSIHQGLANGVNYFDGIFGTSKFAIMEKTKHVKTYIGPLVYISLLKYILRLQFKPAKIFITNIFVNVPDVSILHDPKGYLSTILRKLNGR